jgi:integrase-like protein
VTVRSRSVLGAEVLFLWQQLAFYEERETQPRRLNNSARLSLVIWSQLFDWRSALVIVKPETLIGGFREAIPCDHPYHFLIRDRDSIFSAEVDDQLKAFGLRVLRTPARAPQANAYCERLVGTVRRECLDFMTPLGEKHLSRILAEWVTHYNQGRPHSSLGPGIPEPVEILLPTQPHSRRFSTDIHEVAACPILGGLHHGHLVSQPTLGPLG